MQQDRVTSFLLRDSLKPRASEGARAPAQPALVKSLSGNVSSRERMWLKPLGQSCWLLALSYQIYPGNLWSQSLTSVIKGEKGGVEWVKGFSATFWDNNFREPQKWQMATATQPWLSLEEPGLCLGVARFLSLGLGGCYIRAPRFLS